MCDLLICTEKLRSIFISLRNCSQRFSSALSVNTPQCKFFIWGIQKSATCQLFKSHLIWGSRRPPPPCSSSCRCTSLLWGMYYSAWQFLVHGFRSQAHFLSQTAGFRRGSCRVVVLPRRRYLRSMEAWRLVARWRTSLLVKEGCWGEKNTLTRTLERLLPSLTSSRKLEFWIPAYAIKKFKCFIGEIVISPQSHGHHLIYGDLIGDQIICDLISEIRVLFFYFLLIRPCKNEKQKKDYLKPSHERKLQRGKNLVPLSYLLYGFIHRSIILGKLTSA